MRWPAEQRPGAISRSKGCSCRQRSVVVSGNLPSKDGKYSLYCAVIVKRVDEKTRSKVGINELLRDI